MARKRDMKKQTVAAERVTMAIRNRFDPIPNLTPANLPLMHEGFRQGYLARAARVWEAIAERDYQAKSVIPKREKSLRYGLDYVYSDGMEREPSAERHMKALKYFYENLRCVNVVDQNQRGGLPLLIRTMMSAQGMKYAVHEMVWDVRGREQLTATFWACPLYFFENTTGRLRYLQRDGDVHGVELPEGQWLTTVGEGLMFATATAYMYKALPLRDLLNYCERYAIPGMHGKTDAQPGSPEWNTLEEALHGFAVDFAMITSRGADIEKIDMSASGEVPHPKIIEMMDRAMALLWRGGDLSTMSRGQDAVGASLQEDEIALLEQDDAGVITDTLNEQVDRWVIRYLFDEDPLCWVKVRTAQRKDIKQDVEVDKFLAERGFPETAENLASRYGRTLPESGQKVLPRMQPQGYQAPAFDRPALVNAERPGGGGDLMAAGMRAIAEAQRASLEPLARELQAIYKRAESEDMTDEQVARELSALRDRIHEFYQPSPELSRQIEEILSAAWANEMEEAAHE